MFIGIDIGGTKIAGALVSPKGEVVEQKVSVPTPIAEGGPAILQAAIQVARQLMQGSGTKIQGIGIGAGGQINSQSGVVFSATGLLPGWVGLKIVDGFVDALGVPARVDNDVNVLALGEGRFGAARKFPKGTVVFLALGTGVGGGLLINGQLHGGAHWSGAEFGHILLSMDPNARCDLGGARGTLEAYCSGPALAETYRELSGKKCAGEEVVSAADAGDEKAKEAIRRTGEYLGFGLVSLANAFDPDLIVIGGGLAELGDRLLNPARKILKEMAMPGPGSAPVVVAELGSNAAIVGAASLVIPIKEVVTA